MTKCAIFDIELKTPIKIIVIITMEGMFGK